MTVIATTVTGIAIAATGAIRTAMTVTTMIVTVTVTAVITAMATDAIDAVEGKSVFQDFSKTQAARV